MKTLIKLVITLMGITLVMFSAQAQAQVQGKRAVSSIKESKKINRVYKMSPNYENTNASLRNRTNVRDHRRNTSKVWNVEVKKTHANGRKIKTVKDSTNSGGDKIRVSPPGVPIPYPNYRYDLKEDEEFKDIDFLSRKLL